MKRVREFRETPIGDSDTSGFTHAAIADMPVMVQDSNGDLWNIGEVRVSPVNGGTVIIEIEDYED